MKNEWIMQNYGKNLILAFSGELSFVERSLNFSFNYGVVKPSSKVHYFGSENFKFIVTTFYRLIRGLRREGKVIKIRELIKEVGGDFFKMEDWQEVICDYANYYAQKTIDTLVESTFYTVGMRILSSGKL